MEEMEGERVRRREGEGKKGVGRKRGRKGADRERERKG